MDLIEDRGMLKAIAGEASDSLANSIRYPSLAKWGLLFLFSLIVGLLLSAAPGPILISGGVLCRGRAAGPCRRTLEFAPAEILLDVSRGSCLHGCWDRHSCGCLHLLPQ